MSQQDIFKKAIAAKLAGDEDGFKAAISEAIKAKTKQILGENEFQGPGVEVVGDNWFFVSTPFIVPEGNSSGIPAGQYTASFKARADGIEDQASIEALELHPGDNDSIVASFTGDEAASIANQYLPHDVLMFADNFVEQSYHSPDNVNRRHDDELEDRAAADLSSQRAGM